MSQISEVVPERDLPGMRFVGQVLALTPSRLDSTRAGNERPGSSAKRAAETRPFFVVRATN
jgi:hypothetical protein